MRGVQKQMRAGKRISKLENKKIGITKSEEQKKRMMTSELSLKDLSGTTKRTSICIMRT